MAAAEAFSGQSRHRERDSLSARVRDGGWGRAALGHSATAGGLGKVCDLLLAQRRGSTKHPREAREPPSRPVLVLPSNAGTAGAWPPRPGAGAHAHARVTGPAAHLLCRQGGGFRAFEQAPGQRLRCWSAVPHPKHSRFDPQSGRVRERPISVSLSLSLVPSPTPHLSKISITYPGKRIFLKVEFFGQAIFLPSAILALGQPVPWLPLPTAPVPHQPHPGRDGLSKPPAGGKPERCSRGRPGGVWGEGPFVCQCLSVSRVGFPSTRSEARTPSDSVTLRPAPGGGRCLP